MTVSPPPSGWPTLPPEWPTPPPEPAGAAALAFLGERMTRMPYASLYVVGAHGGAGESTIAALAPGWHATTRRWPARRGAKPACVLVARTNAAGLLAAQRALRAWKSGELAHPVDLIGLILNADAPGRLPRPLRELAAVVAGGAPRTWHLPWNENWRLGEPPAADSGQAVVALLHDLSAVVAPLPDATS